MQGGLLRGGEFPGLQPLLAGGLTTGGGGILQIVQSAPPAPVFAVFFAPLAYPCNAFRPSIKGLAAAVFPAVAVLTAVFAPVLPAVAVLLAVFAPVLPAVLD